METAVKKRLAVFGTLTAIFLAAARPAVHGRDRHHHAPQDRPHRHGRIAEIDRIIQKSKSALPPEMAQQGALFVFRAGLAFRLNRRFKNLHPPFFCAAPAPQGKRPPRG